jgi:ATP-dependent exoDNAse (exonuclease V) alpha subunit
VIIENDYDKEVYNGDIGYIDDVGGRPADKSNRFMKIVSCAIYRKLKLVVNA